MHHASRLFAPRLAPSLVSRSHHRNHTIATHHTLDCFDGLLRNCTSLSQSKQVHAQIILTQTHQTSAFLASRLVSVYSRFGRLADALSVFSALPIDDFNSNLLLWNAILRANVSHGHSKEALNLYFRMRKLGVCPDGFTFPLIIRACSSIGDPDLCSAVHDHVLVMGFQFHLHVANELIGMYGKLGQVDYARYVFDKMPLRNVISWNTVVSGLALNYDCGGAFEVFRRMKSEGWEPNLVTWTSLLSAHARCEQHDQVMELFGDMRAKGKGATAEAVAVVLSVCADSSAFDEGKMIHGYVIKGGLDDYVFVKNSLICMYGKHGDRDGAKSLFSEIESKNLVSWNALISSYAAAGLCDEAFEVFSMLEKAEEGDLKVAPNVISWSAVIGGFASSGRGEESLELFRRMLRVGVEPNSVTVTSVLSVCAEFAAVGLGREIHGRIFRGVMDKNVLAGNGLVNMYAKCGCLKHGRLVFDLMESRDLISWNSMIAGYGMHGFGEDALRTFEEMVGTGLNPDGITFVALLSACSHAGLIVDGGRVFDQMIYKYKLLPWVEHYACMVDLLGRAGLLNEATELVEAMPMKPNVCVWGALLNSCRIYRNTTVAEEAALRIFALESEMTGSYMLLSNIYAACGRWEDSARVRVTSKMKGLKKSQGQSWIEVKKKVYMFSAGNALQPGLEEIYGILEDLALLMDAEGLHT